jgi:hypothetical protein
MRPRRGRDLRVVGLRLEFCVYVLGLGLSRGTRSSVGRHRLFLEFGLNSVISGHLPGVVPPMMPLSLKGSVNAQFVMLHNPVLLLAIAIELDHIRV